MMLGSTLEHRACAHILEEDVSEKHVLSNSIGSAQFGQPSGVAASGPDIWGPVELGDDDATRWMTVHGDVDYAALVSHVKPVVDACNSCRRVGVTSSTISLARRG